ncbi:phosphotransferase family protein [Nocardioides sp. Kera G14]|uniref:phosphotransferase family protein n=1 Tax=Nocardioides sp. Kera G14 TaxID=2884264 RepID=UPI001D1026F2|nr:phosphotransferase family protein [Nocardioides sp. Kera G14]UDY24336.1 phosphotransferase family protein [Nocardioides sp. Kera G14]
MSLDVTSLHRSTRDSNAVGDALTAWLTETLPSGAQPEVVLHAGIETNGMSSETVLLDVITTEEGQRVSRPYVARVAPRAEDLPVFPTYDLGAQFRAMHLAGTLTDVPVPPVSHLEETGNVLGTPFFLMERIEGQVPPDVLPYTFGDNWFYDAGPEKQRELQRSTLEVVAKLHAIPDAASTFDFLDPGAQGHGGETVLARNLAHIRAWYEFAVNEPGGRRSPLVERGFAWLVTHLPATEESVLVWGDARIGNAMYQDFKPVAVLDWEMATVGPREMDIAWMMFAHTVFQEIAGVLELPGLPDFLSEETVRADYLEFSGVELGDLTWYRVLCAVQWACVFLRTSARQIHFGEIERPDDPEAVFHHRPLFERLLDEVGA